LDDLFVNIHLTQLSLMQLCAPNQQVAEKFICAAERRTSGAKALAGSNGALAARVKSRPSRNCVGAEFFRSLLDYRKANERSQISHCFAPGGGIVFRKRGTNSDAQIHLYPTALSLTRQRADGPSLRVYSVRILFRSSRHDPYRT